MGSFKNDSLKGS